MNAIKILEKKFVPLFKSIMEQCSARSIEYILETLDHEIVDSVVGNNEYADYIKEGATKDARIDIKYIVKERETGKVMNISDDAPDGILTTSFYVPVTLHNLFIIDGKVRAPLNYLNTQDKCYRYGPYILAVNPTITLDYREGIIKYSETSDFRDSVSVPFSELHKVPSNLLKLDDEEAKILFLQYNLEHLPKVIDSKLIEDLREPSNKDKDHITRKKIVSAYDALYIHLTRKETRRLLDRKSSTKFFKLHKFYESAVNTSIRNFFKGQSDYLVGVQNESNINPATYETLANKVILERYRNSAGNGVIHQTDYNESLALLVDPSMTPDSSNVNRINEMNKSIRYDGLETFIKVINLKTNKEDEIPLLDYLCEKILTSPHYDYNKKGIKPLKRGDTVHYKTRGDYAKGVLGQTVELKDFKYCDTHSDDRLSRSTRMIPNINFSDSVRTSMGSRMLNQAIEVVSGEEPIVGTGHKDFKDLSLIVKSKSDGVVEKFEDDSLVIKKPDGEKVSYRIPENLESSYNINVSFDVIPKVGDTIKAGQQLIKPKGISEDGSSKLGYNALVAFANYKGLNGSPIYQ